VPLIYVGTKDVTLHEHGKLSDIAPTLLELMDLPIPGDMTGRSLLASPRGLEADAS
jgi:2,3-bisphosphoglycerate-independent phosphoglycerate mutase